MRRSPTALSLVLLIVATASAADPAVPKTVIEISKSKPAPRGLSTIADVPRDREKPFREKVTEVPIDHWAGQVMPPAADGARPDPAAEAEQKKAKEALARANAYTLAGQAGQYVGWFGIVRNVRANGAAHRTELTLQHCYYDDSTDAHQQIVSIFGAGDFTAYVSGEPDGIPPLGLVRVYGKVSAAKSGEAAQVTAEYVRVWNWGLFAFMDYGVDKTNKKWRAMRKLKDADVYASHPTTSYYEAVIGKRDNADAKPADERK